MDHLRQTTSHPHPPLRSPRSHPAKKNSGLLQELTALCRQALAGVRERHLAELTLAHLLGHLALSGRHRITDLMRSRGLIEQDWTADYRLYSHDRLPLPELWNTIRTAFCSHLQPDAPLVVALDDSRLEKSGIHIPGTGWARDPLGPKFQTNLIWALRVVQLAAVCPGFGAHPRTLPLSFVPAPKPPKPLKNAPPPTPEQAAATADVLRQHRLPEVARREVAALREWMDTHGQRERTLLLCFDGGFTNRTLLRHPPGRTAMVGRLRKDAKLFERPEASSSGNGRPRLYGPRAPTPEQMRQADGPAWSSLTLDLGGKLVPFRFRASGPLRSALCGPRDIRVVVVQQESYGCTPAGNARRRRPVYLLCTDLTTPPEQVVRHAFARWGIEVNFRDEKTLIGAGHAQVTHPSSVAAAPGLAVAAYSLLHLAALAAFPDPIRAPVLQPASWQRNKKTSRPYTTTDLLRTFRQEIWGDFFSSNNKSGFVSATPSDTKPAIPFPDLQSTCLHVFSG